MPARSGLGMKATTVKAGSVVDGKQAASRRLNLVRMPSHLGDLSGVSPSERAELVEQDGRRRIIEEMLQGEASALRGFFWAAGICCSGTAACIGSTLVLETVLSPSYAHPDVLVIGFRIISIVGGLAGFVAFYPAIWWSMKWIKAMRCRRRYLSNGTLMAKL